MEDTPFLSSIKKVKLSMTNPENKEIKTPQINDEMTMDQLFAQQDEMQDKLNKKEIVEVTVVQVSQDNVLVDIGSKKEGLIPLSDFEGKEVPAVGSTVTAVLVKQALLTDARFDTMYRIPSRTRNRATTVVLFSAEVIMFVSIRLSL